MDKIKRHFDSEAREFDRIILTLIPHYETMVRALVEAIPFKRSLPLRVVDLGCGTGTVAAKVLEVFPHARVDCVDFAENMIALAKQRLKEYAHVHCMLADFSTFHFNTQYDIALSSLALHHLLTDQDKHIFYRNIYECLNPGGAFFNADVVLASSSHLQTVYMNEWRAFMTQGVSADEIDNKWIPKYQEEDHPAKLIDQLKWMKEIGFVEIDVIWKYFNFAVYGGRKT
jgi:tRNA (cmo5U34)-methyltransferase